MLSRVDSDLAGMAAYERMAELIRQDIRRGALKPGDKLPGNRDLADKYEVALGTAQKALRALQDERWLRPTPSVGVFVNELPDESSRAPTVETLDQRVTELQTVVADLAQRVQQIEGDGTSR